jgi:putative ABC transport system substrate-binding protein
MDRRTFIRMVAGGVVSTPLMAKAQPAGKIYRVGLVLSPSPVSVMTGPNPPHPHVRAFLQGLRDRGYVEGKNIVIERRSGEGKIERLREVLAELVRLQMDVIVVPTTVVAQEAKHATSTIPLVCVCNAVQAGLAASLARPGSNLTGIDNAPTNELAGKRLELFKEAVPKLSRVAAIYAPAFDLQVRHFNEMARAARVLDVTLIPVKVDRPDDFPPAFAAILREHVDGLITADSGLNYSYRSQIADFALQNHLPAIHPQREFTESGALMSYGSNLPDVFRRIGGYVDRILKGAKPADMPIEQPTVFELVINLKTAKALGLTIPPSLLQRADQVIE